MKEVQGKLVATGKRYGIIVARFNEFITKALLSGALDALSRHGANPTDVTVIWVPGAFEIPVVAKRLAQSGSVDGIIGLGAIIRGSTPHFDYVASESAKGVASVMLDTGVPIAYGILTTESIEQAIDRAGAKMGNKGAEAAINVIEMSTLLPQL